MTVAKGDPGISGILGSVLSKKLIYRHHWLFGEPDERGNEENGRNMRHGI